MGQIPSLEQRQYIKVLKQLLKATTATINEKQLLKVSGASHGGPASGSVRGYRTTHGSLTEELKI